MRVAPQAGAAGAAPSGAAAVGLHPTDGSGPAQPGGRQVALRPPPQLTMVTMRSADRQSTASLPAYFGISADLAFDVQGQQLAGNETPALVKSRAMRTSVATPADVAPLPSAPALAAFTPQEREFEALNGGGPAEQGDGGAFAFMQNIHELDDFADVLPSGIGAFPDF